jgi:hypothetical protein
MSIQDKMKQGGRALDLLAEFENKCLPHVPKNTLTAVKFVDVKMKEALASRKDGVEKGYDRDDFNYDMWAVAGLVNLLAEKGSKFRKKIYENCLSVAESAEDKKVFQAFVDGKPLPVKTKRVVTITVQTDELDEEEAVREACRIAGVAHHHHIYREREVKIEVDGKHNTTIYRDRW